MTILNSSSRLKVKRDTFFVPDSNGGVYFRNNVSSFRLEGQTIYQWIEKLVPMFNGEQTLADLTEGLTEPYRNRVYELSETLVKNGFVRDLSKDRPHYLNRTVLERYASQIEFIENFTDSAACRFQQYRQTKPLVIGSGFMAVSMITSLLESGIAKCDVIFLDTTATNRERLQDVVQHMKTKDSEVEVMEVFLQQERVECLWREEVRPYDWVLYVTEDGSIEQLRELNHICKQEGKAFIPAICLEQVGLAGPVVVPEADGCFESAWHRIHQSALKRGDRPQKNSSTAAAVLANVAVFEFFKKVTGVAAPNQSNQIYFLNMETMEGEWLSFITHPLSAAKDVSPRLIEDLDEMFNKDIKRNEHPPNLLDFFGRLTSEETGIFHTWEEHNLSQLPLAQCYVQAVDPLSDGPAELLPEKVCSGFTHLEAQKEAGLAGIEMYVSRWMEGQVTAGVKGSAGLLGIGAGESVEEAVCRGLQAYLEECLRKRTVEKRGISYRLKMGRIEDQRCRFYFHALTTLHEVPAIGMEEDLLGFPVIWVRSKGQHYTKVGLNTTLALRSALKQALMDAQNQVRTNELKVAEGSVFLKLNESTLEIPTCEEVTQLELLRSSIQVINQANKRLAVYDIGFEPFLQEELVRVVGVLLQEVET
ncbi:putative thiazole-containing bacteriocin maturation protein [Bacillus sp. EB600]|uniref:putative thiazole-containing bacteriocin maturation protein n=1 Tax=Bacillus sp. EB600 TaxID=2806345 RepID=UPI00210B4FE3|nr:putative thiazole-containing bacteriocin maturation protein [Bacillus sp. EB600]MCQ6277689.1 putative thiazole-containing bacteriocin maturation protein [Bacillus sp. EB600]